MTKLDEKGKNSAQKDAPTVDRRRARLPQPDFSPYKKAKAYPGASYFFVGHSFNVDSSASEKGCQTERANAIKALFSAATQWVPVHTATANEGFSKVLSRFEADLLHRLPDTALVGPAIDQGGHLIDQSFTVWRKELRKQASK